VSEAHRYEYPQNPDRRCDVVMKGGITSGVVYPLAICRLAERFRLQNIGGTSAGAIAAAAAAAAEYGRRQGTGTRFRELEILPDWLGRSSAGSTDSNLFHLFQPRRSTRALFALLVAAISNPGPTVAVEVLFSALWNWWRRAIVGALPGLAVLGVLVFALAPDGGWLSIVGLFAGILASIALMLIGAVASVAFRIYRSAPAALAGNGFGICSGMRPDDSPDPSSSTSDGPVEGEALTEWMHALIGRASGVGVLTFGHLWGGVDRPRQLDLSMITTCLTLGRPYRLPFELTDAFYFKPDELDDLFPSAVVQHLIAQSSDTLADTSFGEILQLPGPEQLPIVFAARLSLSFPLLLSTVPLYHLNDDRTVTRCLFSDGGISSNFPIDFFDSPLPRWPTFGINLAGPAGADGKYVWMPDDNWALPPPGTRAITGVGGFAASIRGAAQNWHDNQYVEQPGYRDRIVQVRFDEGEGGLNLNMPPKLIERLRDRGDRAGAELVARFTDGRQPSGIPYELDWNNHRRIRLRTALSALEGFVVSFAVGYTGDETVAAAPRRYISHQPAPGEETYEAIAGGPAEPDRYAGFDPAQRTLALAILGKLLPEARGWATARGRDLPPHESPSMAVKSPEPSPELRTVPRL
jgi:predicted acylesterase/phospholipase RssA